MRLIFHGIPSSCRTGRWDYIKFYCFLQSFLHKKSTEIGDIFCQFINWISCTRILFISTHRKSLFESQKNGRRGNRRPFRIRIKLQGRLFDFNVLCATFIRQYLGQIPFHQDFFPKIVLHQTLPLLKSLLLPSSKII